MQSKRGHTSKRDFSTAVRFAKTEATLLEQKIKKVTPLTVNWSQSHLLYKVQFRKGLLRLQEIYLVHKRVENSVPRRVQIQYRRSTVNSIQRIVPGKDNSTLTRLARLKNEVFTTIPN